MFENGITVKQTVTHFDITVATLAWYVMLSTLFKEKGTVIRSVSKSSCHNSGAGTCNTTTQQRGRSEEYIILVGAKQLYNLHYITLDYIRLH